MKDSIVFANLMDEYGRLERQTDSRGLRKPLINVVSENYSKMASAIDANLMQAEERNTGAVSWAVYKKYLSYAGGIVWAPIIIGLLLLDEAARGVWRLPPISDNLFLNARSRK